MTPEKAAMDGDHDTCGKDNEAKRIFKRLDDYLASAYTSIQCLNTSFIPERISLRVQQQSEPVRRRPPEQQQSKDAIPRQSPSAEHLIPDLDPKLLLLGDFAENGSWWTGSQEGYKRPVRTASKKASDGLGPSLVSHRTPHIDWDQLDEWYETVINCAKPWRDIYDDLVTSKESLVAETCELQELETRLLRAQDHTHRHLMKATESLLKRPGRPVNRPSDLRFILVLLANPLLYASHKLFRGQLATHASRVNEQGPRASGPVSGQNSGVIKRILGLLSNTPPECHNYLIAWFAKYPEPRFANLKDLVGGFLAYRLRRQHDKKHDVKVDVVEGLIPSMSDGRSAASLHASLRPGARSNKKRTEPANKQVYHDDWQIRAAAQVMALVFAANNVNCSRKNTLSGGVSAQNESNGTVSRHNVQARGQLLPTSDFYTALLDDMDLVADFEAWSQKKGKFAFCQYPFLLSIWAKIQILEYDTRRQMEVKARDAFFDNILSRGAMVSQHLILEVRRDCLVEDSLKAVSEVIGSGSEDIKKGLKVVFKGEEGVDFGGIRKEWFLLLVREVFNPDHGEC
jgi:E3 ubiquitin-protein ligase HECTD2